MLSVERDLIERASRQLLDWECADDGEEVRRTFVELRALLDKPAADFNPEHTLFNEIRTSTPVNDESEPLQYLVSEQQLQRIRQLESPAAQHQGEPVALQHMAVAEDGKLRWMTGRKMQDCELYAMPDGSAIRSKLFAEQPAPVSAEAANAFAKGFSTLETVGGKYKIVMQFSGHDDAWIAYTALGNLTKLAKVKP